MALCGQKHFICPFPVWHLTLSKHLQQAWSFQETPGQRLVVLRPEASLQRGSASLQALIRPLPLFALTVVCKRCETPRKALEAIKLDTEAQLQV